MVESMQADLVVVANRLPVDRVTNSDGTKDWRTSPGGLVTAIEPVLRENDGVWIGWPGGDDTDLEPFSNDGLRLVPMSLSAAEIEDYYEGFSNATLWPLYHDLAARPSFHREWWDAYQRVNRRFADKAAEVGGCLREGLRESPLVPHAQTLTLLRQMDDVRRQVGVEFT